MYHRNGFIEKVVTEKVLWKIYFRKLITEKLFYKGYYRQGSL